MTSHLSKFVSRWILAGGVAVALAASASAQRGNIQSVTFYTVKPERISDFQAEIKEFNTIYAKAGSTEYSTMWMSLTGSREYVRVSYFNKWADLDAGPDPKVKDDAVALARISQRIVDCTEGSRRIINEVQPDLSVETDNDIPKMIRVLTTDVRPDRYNDFLALMKSDNLPAAQKGGLKLYQFSETRYGAPNTEVTSIVAMDSWGDLDTGVGMQKVLGKDGYQALMQKVRPLIEQAVVNEYRYLPEISYLPAVGAK